MARITHAKEGQQGPQGERGEKGERGLKGEQGERAQTFEFKQETPAAEWHIVHELERKPSVVIEDTANDVVDGIIEYVSFNILNLKFSAPFAGIAYLN